MLSVNDNQEVKFCNNGKVDEVLVYVNKLKFVINDVRVKFVV